MAVDAAQVLLGHAFYNKYHHVHGAEAGTVGRHVYGRVQGFGFGIAHIVWRDERLLVQRTEDGKGSIEHDAGIERTVDILVGVADGNGSGGRCHASAHTENGKWDGQQQADYL